MINKSALLQYIVIYVMLLVQGTAFENTYHDLFQAAIFVIGIVYCVKQFLSKKKFIHITVLVISLFITYILTHGSLTIASSITLINTFLLVACVYKICPDKVSDRIIKLIYGLSIISLVFYAIQMINPSLLKSISIPYTFASGDAYWVNGKRVDLIIYFNFLFSFSPYAQRLRNCGIYTEPGVYAMVVTAALFLLIYNKKKMPAKKFNRYLFVFIITMISTQSTMGLMCLGVILLYLLFINRADMGNVKIILILAGVVVAVVSISQGLDSFIYKNILKKIYDVNKGIIDLSVSTGASRIESIRADMKLALTHPFGVGYLKYIPMWNAIKKNIPDTASCVGLTKNLAVFGFIPIIYTISYYCNVFRNKNKSFSVSYCVCLLIMFFSQPNFFAPVLMLVSYMADKEISYEEKDCNWRVES
ncbi:hypothetical protein DWX57_08795 [Coprococcus sp. AF19-8AC]|uniref:hypothetical protein n=1 Tax=Coprococcus sp. AF19-8AC TaxID=2293090 RepID=UPI000E75AB51|nr:hypothetical protein [Coprococcus sp. AF19-8AC]RJV45100.1 hypothetical protein DWX57_08795 [Coprococcus sp. AF19-8AC]